MPNKITKKEFQLKINMQYPDEDIEIIDYNSASKPGKYKCLSCNKVFSIYKMGDLLKKKHCCNYCNYGPNSGAKTKEKQQLALELIKNNNLLFISFEYNSSIYKPTIKFKCLNCNQIQEKQLINFLQHPNCFYCCESAKKMNSIGLSKRIPEEYTLLEEYKGADNKVLFRHEKCGFIWKTAPHNIISGCGCPKCAPKRSKGEKRIIDFLERSSIKFITEKSFDWSNKKRYDFYLSDYNLLIEYHGIQHYENIKFHGKYNLKEIQDNDNWKKQQALLHNFSFLEISYKDFDKIETILAQRLSLNGSSESETENIPLG